MIINGVFIHPVQLGLPGVMVPGMQADFVFCGMQPHLSRVQFFTDLWPRPKVLFLSRISHP